MQPYNISKKIVFLIMLLLLVFPVSSQESQEYESEKQDCILHFLAGMSSAFLVSAAAFTLLDDSNPQKDAFYITGAGFLSAAAAGSGKELIDYLGVGNPEWKDFFSTLAGGAVASGIVYAVFTLFGRSPVDRTGGSIILGSFSFVLMMPVIYTLINNH